MNVNACTLVATVVPLLTLASALPHNYVPLQTNTASGIATGEVADRLNFVRVDGNDKNKDNSEKQVEESSPPLQSENKPAPGELVQCGTDNNFTFFSEQPLPSIDKESILIEECDPFNPDQIRLAYVANKSISTKTSSPTSTILIGCTTVPSNSFNARHGGAFKKVSTGNYTNFIRRANPMGSTLVQRHPKVALIKRPAAMKRSTLEGSDSKLDRRWESRSDVDQYSDGFHSCRSNTSSFCRIPNEKKVCLELRGALKANLPSKMKEEVSQESKRIICDNSTGQCVETISHVISNTPQNSLEPLTVVNKEDGVVAPSAEPTIRLPNRTLSDFERLKDKEHDEFMRRWLQGEENPRSFLLRSEGQTHNELIQRRAVDPNEERGDAPMITRGYYDHDDTCSDWSDQYKERCKGRWHPRQRWSKRSTGDIIQRRAVGTALDEKDVMMGRRGYYDHDDTCSDWSDQYKERCKGRWHPRQQNRSVDGQRWKKRSTGDQETAAENLEKRGHHGRWRGGRSRCGSSNCRRDIDDDVLTVRSTLSEHGNLVDSILIDKREQITNKRLIEEIPSDRKVKQDNMAEPITKRDCGCDSRCPV